MGGDGREAPAPQVPFGGAGGGGREVETLTRAGVTDVERGQFIAAWAFAAVCDLHVQDGDVQLCPKHDLPHDLENAFHRDMRLVVGVLGWATPLLRQPGRWAMVQWRRGWGHVGGD